MWLFFDQNKFLDGSLIEKEEEHMKLSKLNYFPSLQLAILSHNTFLEFEINFSIFFKFS